MEVYNPDAFFGSDAKKVKIRSQDDYVALAESISTERIVDFINSSENETAIKHAELELKRRGELPDQESNFQPGDCYIGCP